MRSRGRAVLAAAVTAVVLAGCTHRLLDFTVLSSKNLDVAKMSQLERAGARQTGKDTTYVIIFIPIGLPDLKGAIDRALEKVPGAVALADGVVRAKSMWFVLFGFNSIIVEGTPLIDPTLLRSGDTRPSDFMVSYIDPASKDSRVAYLSEPEFRQVRKAIHDEDSPAVESVLAAHR